ncbi:hypothetical protein TKK_0009434 [Trichogramma kaykai]
MEEHQNHLKIVLKRLDKFNLRLNIDKCVFAKTEVSFLSHLINAKGFSPLPDKVKAISEFPQPTNVDELRRFLGVINFYRPFIKNAAELLLPLNCLITGSKKKDRTPILWSDAATMAFQSSKDSLASVILLAYPKESSVLRLVTDASTLAAGAVLEQETEFGWQPLSFFSKKFTTGQKKYSPYDLELTAIYLAVKHFHSELEGRYFEIYCDHKPLQYAFVQTPEHAPLVRQRQLAYISQYCTSIKYLPGKDNSVADALSRADAPESSPATSASDTGGQIDAFAFPTDLSITKLSSEQLKDEELTHIISDEKHPTKLQCLIWPVNNQHIPLYCDMTDDIIRPFIPKSLRREIFMLFHKNSHPGPSSTDRLIRRKYMWPGMSRDIAAWCKICLPCQQN